MLNLCSLAHSEPRKACGRSGTVRLSLARQNCHWKFTDITRPDTADARRVRWARSVDTMPGPKREPASFEAPAASESVRLE
jgi:hypothetical protein